MHELYLGCVLYFIVQMCQRDENELLGLVTDMLQAVYRGAGEFPVSYINKMLFSLNSASGAAVTLCRSQAPVQKEGWWRGAELQIPPL